jgi:hypothetical protein
VPAGDYLKFSENLKREETWEKFEDFLTNHFAFWTVKISKESSWECGSCDGPNFSKKLACKHLIGVAARLSFFKFSPTTVRTMAISAKRRRGRPKKAQKALIKN